jgi:hypothetical protein
MSCNLEGCRDVRFVRDGVRMVCVQMAEVRRDDLEVVVRTHTVLTTSSLAFVLIFRLWNICKESTIVETFFPGTERT